jgi:glutamate synthase (NADPH/NADH) small chain
MYTPRQAGRQDPATTASLAIGTRSFLRLPVFQPDTILSRKLANGEKSRIPLQKVAKQSPARRLGNFQEVSLGFTPEQAVVEAARCFNCTHHPCTEACPVHNEIPTALFHIEIGDFTGAAEVFRRHSTLPEVCGRLCPQEKLCEGGCIVGNLKDNPPVAIGKLEAFCTDFQRRALGGFPMPDIRPPTGKRVAVVGTGPAGLAAAEDLAAAGHSVTAYDMWPQAGGLLIYGIPGFKLEKQMILDKLDMLRRMGVTFVTGVRIGEDLTVDQLLAQGFDAVFLGTGAPIGNTLDAPGENLERVYQATDFLVRGNLPPELLPEQQRDKPLVGARTLVVGGGDTAMDCVRTAVRLAAPRQGEVVCVYRRSKDEMTGRLEEQVHAVDEGVKFEFQTAPVKLVSAPPGETHELSHLVATPGGLVRGAVCVRMAMGEPDASGRRSPVMVPDSEFFVEADTVVLAIGYSPDPLVPKSTPGLESDRKFRIKVKTEETGETSRPGVFAAGDNVRGADLIVTAIAAARAAARACDAFLRTRVGERAATPAAAGSPGGSSFLSR